ncbi:MAG: ATP-binding protein [Coriobacteriales bacterium]|jgi:AAA+ ATPase superfamily predicted ATPase|nr:ATP-binding protein [Coriobacteriales bacterium]
MEITGRKAERQLLQECALSGRPVFLAIYGRRRIGKTYLVKEHFNNHFTFYVTAEANVSKSDQLAVFDAALDKYFTGDIQASRSWLHAFTQLESQLTSLTTTEKKIIFIDELPWFDTRKSGFLPALEHFWNSFASSRPDIMLIVCGSAASWMIKNLIDSYGGLHNRVTHSISLEPFTLAETEEFCRSHGVVFNRHQLAEAYMILGGIPYYLELLNKGLSLSQNVDALFFAKNAPLKNEFDRLFRSLYRSAGNHIRIIEALGTQNTGLSRHEIIKACGISDGGALSGTLRELEQCGFISTIDDYNKRRNGEYYHLVDFFSLYYLRYVKGNRTKDEHYWTNYLLHPAHGNWCGHAFERLCLAHIPQIKACLGITGVITNACSWRSTNSASPLQIDLVINRKDQVINLCEIKYTTSEFSIDADYAEHLAARRQRFISETATRSAIHQTMITTYGLTHNAFANNIQSQITLDDLFAG